MLETLGIGASLREERIRQGLTLDGVESATRIRGRYLEAIEDERWDELPAEAYAKGFLRTYATFLELDPQQFLAEFRRHRREVEEPIAPLAQPAYEARGVRLAALGTAAAVVTAVLAVGAWQLAGDDPMSERAVGPQTTQAQPQPAPAQPARPARPVPPLVLRAAAATWLEVRLGGPGGKRAWTGTLRPGRVLTLGLGKPLWLSAGRPDVLRATRGGRRVRVPDATTLVASAEGLRAA
jgi:Helix-turn-helix domain/Domain of unknown function (DUF4115)